MKKILIVFGCLVMAQISNSQTWNIGLNNIAGNPYFGTTNAKPINFFTSNTMRMTISTTGKIQFNDLAGSADRFLQVDASGQLKAYEGVYPFSSDGTTTYLNTGSKFGVGISTPATELDVNGGAQVANAMRVGGAFYVGPTTNYGIILYTPGTAGQPAVFSFGGGGTAHPKNPNPGSVYNPFGNGNEHPTDNPPIVDHCADGNPAQYNPTTINLFSDMISVKKENTANNTTTLLGNINIGHNGNNAFIETQGTNSLTPAQGDLYINKECGRNIYAFGNGASFAVGTDKVMSIAGRLNVTQNVQIGGGTALTSFQQGFAALFINAPAATANAGLRIFHAGSEAGIKVVEQVGSSKAFVVHNGTSNTVDGPERFCVRGDGKTTISTNNADAITVFNAATTGTPQTFNVAANGYTSLKTTNTDAITIFNSATTGTPQTFNIAANGYTSLKTTNTKAFSIFNASNSNNETFFINNTGYTEIKVYSPLAMPNSYSSANRAFTIRDMSANSGLGKDIFVVNTNGVAYAREIEITTVNNFPDYVFDKNYDLKSIGEVERYIHENKHLPGFEKASTYEEKGINVNTMLLKQQEKIEELTLYIIDLEKRLQSLEVKK
ncbi:hypothetical protein CNR22_07590 [Sphingobacteriaceae bacterium]|nr:hypothetical protein CNR22_07590 [Sphingobacteriaceae bacterium]